MHNSNLSQTIFPRQEATTLTTANNTHIYILSYSSCLFTFLGEFYIKDSIEIWLHINDVNTANTTCMQQLDFCLDFQVNHLFLGQGYNQIINYPGLSWTFQYSWLLYTWMIH